MNVRVTNQTQSANALFFLRQQAGEAAKWQDQLSSGQKVKASSDNPAAYAAITQSVAISRRTGTYQQTLNDATADLNTGVSSLVDAGQVMGKARELAIRAANSGNDASEYEAYATEVDSLLNEMLDISNRQSDGRYLFGGTADGAKPFRVDTLTPGGRPATIAYDGAAERASGRIGPSQTVDTKYVGSQVFQASGADVFAELIGLRDDLRNGTLTAGAKAKAISTRIGTLEAAQRQLGSTTGEQSAALAGMESLQQRLVDLKLNADSRVTDLAGTDYAEAVVKLKEQETAYQATLGVTSRLIQPSLLDFIR
jgi:flagellar hook-associated protein 3 FlgL